MSDEQLGKQPGQPQPDQALQPPIQPPAGEGAQQPSQAQADQTGTPPRRPRGGAGRRAAGREIDDEPNPEAPGQPDGTERGKPQRWWQGLPQPTVTKPDAIFFFGLAAGLLLTFSEGITDRLGILHSARDVTTYTGIGLVLGAFGSLATVQWKGVVVTGVGALAIAMFAVFGSSPERAAIGTLHDSSRATEVLFRPAPFVMSRPTNQDDWRFTLRATDIDSAYFRLSAEFSGASTDFACVPYEAVRIYFGRRSIDWQIDRERGVLRDRRLGKDIARTSDRICGAQASNPTEPVVPPRPSGSLLRHFVGEAFAQSIATPPDPLTLGEPGLAQRLDARDTISRTMTRESYRSQIDTVRTLDPGSDRTSLILHSLLRAWNDLFARSSERANAVFTGSVTVEDLQFIIGLMGYRVTEVQNASTEFLANFALLNLQNARIVTPLLFRAAMDGTGGPIGRINSLIVIRSIYCREHTKVAVSAEMINSLMSIRDASGPGTRSVLDDLSARRCNPRTL